MESKREHLQLAPPGPSWACQTLVCAYSQSRSCCGCHGPPQSRGSGHIHPLETPISSVPVGSLGVMSFYLLQQADREYVSELSEWRDRVPPPGKRSVRAHHQPRVGFQPGSEVVLRFNEARLVFVPMVLSLPILMFESLAQYVTIIWDTLTERCRGL
jgi:hypothetical protein